MAGVFVARPGLQTTVQDLGRWGYQAEGVPVAGAMDASAHRRANALVGNPLSAATLEVTLVGPELRFDDERRVGVCGAGFDLRHDGEAVASEGTVQVRAGSTLQFGARISGARAYIAVSGGFDVPAVLGSRSTHISSAMGGLEGRALRAGDFLPIGPAPRIDGPPRHVANVRVRAGGSPGRLRVLSGQDLESFEDGALAEFESTTYVVGNDSNRMGYRLQGHPLRLRGARRGCRGRPRSAPFRCFRRGCQSF